MLMLSKNYKEPDQNSKEFRAEDATSLRGREGARAWRWRGRAEVSGGRGVRSVAGSRNRAAPGTAPPPDLRNDAWPRKLMAALVWWLAACCLVRAVAAGNPDAKRLYDDLLSNYNKLVRPVVNTTDVLRVCIKLKLSQLIDVVSLRAHVNILVFHRYSLNPPDPNRQPRVHCECILGCTCAPHLEFK